MEKSKITPLSAACIYILFMLSSVQVLNLFESGRSDLWVSVLISVLFSVPTLLICLRLCSLFPGEDLFSVIYKSCGRFFGAVLTVFYIIYALFVTAISFRFISEFVRTVSFPKTPPIVILSVFAYLCCRTLKYGKRVFSRFCLCIFPFIIAVIFLIAFLSADLYDVSSFRPVLLGDLPQISSVGLGISSFSFGETVLLIGFISSVSSANGSLGLAKKNMGRVVLWGSAVSAFLIMGIMMSNVLILGEETMKRMYFPYYVAVSLVDVDDFITHIEVIAVIIFILSLIVKTGVGLGVTAEGISKLFRIKQPEKILFPLAFFIIILALQLFYSAQEMTLFAELNKYIGLVFQLPLPLVILICAEVRRLRREK